MCICILCLSTCLTELQIPGLVLSISTQTYDFEVSGHRQACQIATLQNAWF